MLERSRHPEDGLKSFIGDPGLDQLLNTYLDYREALGGGSSIEISDTYTVTAIPLYFTTITTTTWIAITLDSNMVASQPSSAKVPLESLLAGAGFPLPLQLLAR